MSIRGLVWFILCFTLAFCEGIQLIQMLNCPTCDVQTDICVAFHQYPRYYDCVRLDAIPCWLWEALYAQRDDDHCISHLPIDSPSMGSSAAAGIASARFMVSAVALVALIL